MAYNTIISWKLCWLTLAVGMIAGMVWSCEERYYPEIEQKYEEILVVDGMITNRPGPYSVVLSLSTLVDNPEFIPVSDYQVVISDDLGNSEILGEDTPGTYSTSPDGIQGVVGRSYRIELTSPEGINYRSEFEELKTPVPVDSLYAEIEYQPSQGYPFGLPGYRFYVDASGSHTDTIRLLWRLTETYKYKSDFKIYFTYDGVLHTVLDPDTLRTCFKTERIDEFFLFNSEKHIEPNVDRLKLHFVSTDTRRLSYRYSLLAEQYRISKPAYEYWAGIKELQSETGDLYSKLPYQVRGNIYNENNAESPVFGYFMVAGVNTRRIFVNTPKPPVKLYIPKCVLVQGDFVNYGFMFFHKPPPPDDPYYITQSPTGARALTIQSCLDCRMKGGVLEEPDFWIEN